MKVAIDVVLLLSAEMAAKAIRINQELLKHNEATIVLGDDCLPHISLYMGAVEEADIPRVQDIVAGVCSEFSPLELVAECITADVIATGQKASGLRIKDDEALRRLQAAVMEKLWPYLSYDVTADMFFEPMQIEDITLAWVKNYARTHEDPSLFRPHITVGVGETAFFKDEFPLAFNVSVVALCQLGNYCTARKVLSEHKLTQPDS